jgi:chitin disaccharide deacetylase
MRRLLIHADDLGFTAGVTRGIVEAGTRGVVTGSSAMVCSPQQRHLVSQAVPQLQGRIGLHLQLTGGRPVSDPALIPTLVDCDGNFPAHRSQIGDINPAEVLIEWRAQLQALVQLGVTPSHIDTHHHVHTVPAALDAYIRLAQELKVPARVLPEGVGGSPAEVRKRLRAAGVICTDFFVCIWSGKSPNTESLIRALRVFAHLGGERCSLEIGCHPGYSDEELAALSRYSGPREEELAILLNPETAARVKQAGWTLLTAADLR